MEYPNLGAIVEDKDRARRDFFNLIFGRADGYVCLGFKFITDKMMRHEWFRFPAQLDDMLRCINNYLRTPCHMYFCPQVFKDRKRARESVLCCPTAWADLDECSPDNLAVQPTVLTQTSPGRYQALWVFDRLMSPPEAENISRRIAYAHAASGADTSCWDMIRFLRIPYTTNLKYSPNDPPMVIVLAATTRIFRKSDFDVYPEAAAFREIVESELPEISNEDPLEIMQRYRVTMNPQAFSLFSTVPTGDDDWSGIQWKLGRMLVEAGLDRAQVYQVLSNAECNKYKRDDRNKNDLWKEVQRLFIKRIEVTLKIPNEVSLSSIITDQEVSTALSYETFIERYINWAIQLTDAPPQFHQAGAFTLLGALISGAVVLPTSFGMIMPNMWFMLAADTTLARKTTSLNIAIRMLFDIREDTVFATDGTMEGILTGLKSRDGQPALFYRDEFTGLLQAMIKKDYMADMPEHLTKLYDGEPMRRLLRREEISVYRPVFLMLTGGIKTKIQSLLTEEQVSSGFIPRFVFITAETDMDRVRPVGPPVADNIEYRETIKNELIDISNHYDTATRMDIRRGNEVIATQDTRVEASLTQECWIRYNQLETTMTKDAIDTGLYYLTPVYDRLAKSTLKAAILIAASRQRSNKVVVELPDLLKAIYYCRGWRSYANEMVLGLGKSPEERTIEAITIQLRNAPKGLLRSQLMKFHKLNAKAAASIFDTMLQRQLVYGVNMGNDTAFHHVPED